MSRRHRLQREWGEVSRGSLTSPNFLRSHLDRFVGVAEIDLL